MTLTTTRFAAALLIAAGPICTHPCAAQTALAPTILDVTVSATGQCANSAPSLSPPPPIPAASPVVSSRAITRVNGQAARGSFMVTLTEFSYPEYPDAPMRSAFAPIDRPASLATWTFDLQQADGTPIGAIVANGDPHSLTFPIVAGTGVYYGMQGLVTAPADNPGTFTSLTQSGSQNPPPTFRLTLYPLALPTVVEVSGGPAIVHGADSAQISASQPAHSGEVVTVYALNLLPQPPSAGGTSAALPVSVTIGGMDAPVLWAGRYRNSPDGYQINVKVPAGLNSGLQDLRIASGFIAGPPVPVYVDGRAAQ